MTRMLVSESTSCSEHRTIAISINMFARSAKVFLSSLHLYLQSTRHKIQQDIKTLQPTRLKS